MSNKSRNKMDTDPDPHSNEDHDSDNDNYPPLHSPGAGNRVLELIEKHKRDVQERMTNRENAFRDILVRELARRLERERSNVTLRNCDPNNPTHSSSALDVDGNAALKFSENTFRRAFDEAFDTASTEVVLSSRESSIMDVHISQSISKSRMQREKERRRERMTGETAAAGSSQAKRKLTKCEPTPSATGERVPSVTVTATTPRTWRDSIRLENMKELAGIAIILLLSFGVLLFAFYVRPSATSSAKKTGARPKVFRQPVM